MRIAENSTHGKITSRGYRANDRIGIGPKQTDSALTRSARARIIAASVCCPYQPHITARCDSMYKPNTIGAVLLSLNFGVEDLKPFSALLHPDAPAVIRTRQVLAFGSLLYRRFVRNHGNVSAGEDDFHVGK